MKRLIAVTGAAVLALAALVPMDQVTADGVSTADQSLGSKAVVESETGSYIVVMSADPLITTVAPDDLSTGVADVQSCRAGATHDAVLAEAGIDPATKVQDYTNALNGFSARLDHNQAVRDRCEPEVSLVLPDELRHITMTRRSMTDDDGDGHDGHGHDGISQK